MKAEKKSRAINKKTLTSHKVLTLQGEIEVPGDKSISHRALILASQVIGTTYINGLLEGEDVLCTAAALQECGIDITHHGQEGWKVKGNGIGGLHAPAQILDMGNSGTAARLLMGLLASYPFKSFFMGDKSLSQRPMQRVITPLEQMGATFAASNDNTLPLLLHGNARTIPVTYTMPVASAQVKSALMLAAINTAGTTTIVETHPTRDHTERMMRYFGMDVSIERKKEKTYISVRGHPKQHYTEHEIHVPGDPSSAAFLVVATLITPKASLIIRNVGINDGRTGLYTTLKEMGASVTYKNMREIAGESVADIHVKTSKLKGIEVPAERAASMIDEYPILAIAAAVAKGPSVMHGLEELRVKESDRLQAIIDGLRACGIDAYAQDDSLHITGLGRAPQGGCTVTTHYDHRIAMAFLVMGLISDAPISVDDGSAIATSFPNFVELMNRCGACIESPPSFHPMRRSTDKADNPLIIAIDGPAASGKGTLARRLADHFGYAYLDTGSLYRAVGMKLVYSDQDPHDTQAAIDAAQSINDHDFTNPRLRHEKVGQAASIISAMPEVRAILLDYQRTFAARPQGAVLDGRDIGTVVCPDADIKIFMTASIDTRADRRHRQLQNQGIEVVYESVKQDLIERDKRDSDRKAAPLIAAKDAIELDTTDLSANEVFAQVLTLVENI